MGHLYTLELYFDLRYGIFHGQTSCETGDDSAGMGLCTDTGHLGGSAGSDGSFWNFKFSGNCVTFGGSGISLAEADAGSVGDVMFGSAFGCVLDSAPGRPGHRQTHPDENTGELL